MLTDAQAHAALEARDRRYDGVFFTGVTSTRIYCRCVCTARAPKRENRRFYPSAAAAEGAGFRPCLLCRPELAPGLSQLEAGERLASAALSAIEAGALDEGDLEVLAARLGASSRHVRRAIAQTYGASPIALAQTHRLLTAKRLLRDTDLSVTDVAFAAGFQSLRRFNALFQERYRLSPSRIRAQRAENPAQTGLRLRLAARGGFQPEPAFDFLKARAVTGLEQIEQGAYHRLIRLSPTASPMPIALAFDAAGVMLQATPPSMAMVRPLIARVTAAFDLNTDIAAVDAHLAKDPAFAPDIAADPGVRLVLGLDPFEVAVRAVIGQQITVAGARTLLARLCALTAGQGQGVLVFPTPQDLCLQTPSALAGIGLPKKRAETLHALARAALDDPDLLTAGADRQEVLKSIPGIGPWTAGYIALRAFGDADVFPSGDVVLQSAAGLKAKALEDAAEAWRPYRGYAALRLWRRAARQKRSPE
jgi:AraC family transcriptional regulator, regulatory protein of adaptative response / DNA-3-methyladenine glycosylase II